MTATDQINKLKTRALNEDESIKLAYLDCLEQLARFAILDRPPRESVRLLSNWCDTFAKLDAQRRIALEKARRP